MSDYLPDVYVRFRERYPDVAARSRWVGSSNRGGRRSRRENAASRETRHRDRRSRGGRRPFQRSQGTGAWRHRRRDPPDGGSRHLNGWLPKGDCCCCVDRGSPRRPANWRVEAIHRLLLAEGPGQAGQTLPQFEEGISGVGETRLVVAKDNGSSRGPRALPLAASTLFVGLRRVAAPFRSSGRVLDPRGLRLRWRPWWLREATAVRPGARRGQETAGLVVLLRRLR